MLPGNPFDECFMRICLLTGAGPRECELQSVTMPSSTVVTEASRVCYFVSM